MHLGISRSKTMENTENVPYRANRGPQVGYSIEFEPVKPKAAVPKCVTEYCSKPKQISSPVKLQEKQDRAAIRRKVMHS